MLGRVIGFIVTTFVIAMIYGLFVTTMDFMGAGSAAAAAYDPVASGHRAADRVYGLFGTVSTEVRRNEADAAPRAPGVAHKIAAPYAFTADVAAILGGKIEVAATSFFRTAQGRMDRNAAARG